MVIFDNFTIVGSDGLTYTGVRPGLVPKPFKYIDVKINGKVLLPGHHESKSHSDIIGFDLFFIGQIFIIFWQIGIINRQMIIRSFGDNRLVT